MAEYHCRYESHLGQAILGFCVNIDCQQNPQFCLKCLKNQQNNHSSQCLGFDMITENLSKYIQQEKLFYEQLQEIDKTFQMLLGQSLKKIQKNLKKLQNLNETLQKGEYLKFKTEINFFRRYYSKVEETEKSEFLTSLNSIVLTLQTTTKGYVKIEDQQIAQTGDNHSQYLSRAKGRFDQGEKLFRERKYQEALTAFNDSLLMGYNHDFVYNWKAITLNHLNKYDEAIKCFDLALQINSTYESAYNNKGALLNNLGKYEEALLYIQTAIDLNPINYLAYSNKGFALCNLQRFQEALIAYEMAIEFNNHNDKAHHNRGIYKMYNIIQELHYSNLIELKMLFNLLTLQLIQTKTMTKLQKTKLFLYICYKGLMKPQKFMIKQYF
ncbi:unnamed protein product [Paramecium pentaurelia]|uniref:Tetratricopeptide repeat protein n=1 Tax=Paramecium pentaurelia TaxID=43138 RepID=A0A8S1WGV6_9CILI|nr:unnamed protein product [Paramecium pentaurelia]